MFYRVTVECEVIVEAESAEVAEEQAVGVAYNDAHAHMNTTVLDLTVPCNKDGEEIEDEAQA